MQVKNLFKTNGSKVLRPFASCGRLYLIFTRSTAPSVRVRTRRSSKSTDFVWPLPTSLSVNGLAAISDFCARKASDYSGDLKPEDRYELETSVASRIWEIASFERHFGENHV